MAESRSAKSVSGRFAPENLIRPNIRSLVPYRCARDAVQEGVLLDANENPFPRRCRGVAINRYPDPHQKELRNALAEYLRLSPEQVLAGNGSDEVLDWILKVFCSPGKDRLAVAPPTYGMYRVTADILGVELFSFPLTGDFSFNAERFLGEVPPDVKVLILCSPNNPTGNLIRREAILSVASCWNGIVVVDEAYIEFAGTESLAAETEDHPNLVVMRTFSKALGRAGLRLGYVVASSRLIEFFRRVKMPYNLNSLTQSQGAEVLRTARQPDPAVEKILRERTRLENRLRRIKGVGKVHPSRANFILFECRSAAEIYRKLLLQGIVIRDRSTVPGLENCLRVSVGTRKENDSFLKALEAGLEECE